MNGFYQTIRIGLMLSSLLAGGRVLAAEGEREVAVEINKANGLLRSGDVDGAVKAYQQVQGGARDRADLSYNMAVAQYRKGDMAAAEQLFNQASASGNDALAAKARYNLGNCNYAAALRAAEKDHPAAIKGLEKAIENYRSALEVDSNDADSRANIELASAMIDKLREQDKKQQQQQQQKQQDQKDQQNKDQKDQKQENSKQQENQEKKDSQQQKGKDQQQSQEKQQNQQQKSDSSNEKKSQDNKSSENQQQKKDEKSKENSSDESKSESQEQKSQPQESKSEQKDSKSGSQGQEKGNSGGQKQGSKSQDQSQATPDKPQDDSADEKKADQTQQRQSQTSAKQKPKDQQPTQAESKQSEQEKEQKGSAAPKGTLSAADQKAGKADAHGKEVAGKPEVVKEGEMTVQEAEKMLQAIRDQEMIRRLKRQATERNQHVPVDRDW
jgi:hypothetical protein